MVDIGGQAVGGPELARERVGVSWSAVFAGALCGTGLAFVLDAFGAAIGLAVSSTAPTWRDASFGLVFLSGVYLILTAVVSYGSGAYLAARLGDRFAEAAEMRETHDGALGLVVWGMMTLVTALMLAIGTVGLSHLSTPSSGANGAATSVAGENIIAFDLDKLFRSSGRSNATPNPYVRSEAARILLTTSSHRGLLPEDRNYLVALVERVTGLPGSEAQGRTNAVATSAKQDINRARNSGVILAFMLAAAALLGALAAWIAAGYAGRERDGLEAPWRGAGWRAPSIRF
jgi:hypothetical protein